MRTDYCIGIVTYKRPQKQITYRTLKNQHSTAPTFLIVEETDPTLQEYRETYPGQIITFNREGCLDTDCMDNFRPRRGVVYARNETRRIAERLGYTHYVMLDDDYDTFAHRYKKNGVLKQKPYPNLDELFSSIFDWMDTTPLHCVCLAQNGDLIGGLSDHPYKRKAMNTYFMNVERAYPFMGTLNEDTNAYTANQQNGMACLTLMDDVVDQVQTQKNAGGLTDLYLDVGTYVKSFYSVMVNPASNKISVLADAKSPHPRIHHECTQNKYAPCFVRENSV